MGKTLLRASFTPNNKNKKTHMSYSISGKIKVIKDIQVLGTKGFQKREFVVEVVDDKYTQTIPLEFVKDKCSLLDNFSEGQEVTVQFNLRGNEYNGRYFLSAQAWRIEGGSGGAPAKSAAGAKPAARPAAKPVAQKAAAADEDAPW